MRHNSFITNKLDGIESMDAKEDEDRGRYLWEKLLE